MQKLLTDTLDRLKAEVSALKYIDEDWGQLDFYFPNPPVKFPCALVDATQVNWSNQGRRGQMGLVQVKVRIADMKLSNTSNAAPQAQKDKAFAIYDVLQAVHRALHGWTGASHYTALIRATMTRAKREDGVRIYELTFTTEITDNSAAPERERITVVPVIKV